MQEFFQFALLGAGAGGIYALVALGLVLIYRGSGVLNFAQGAIGMAGTFVYYEFHDLRSWPFAPAFAIGVAFCATLGVLIHYVVMRPLRNTSKLTQLIATIGVLLVVQGIALHRYESSNLYVVPSLPQGTWSIFGARVGQDRILICLIATAITVVLWIGYRTTAFGRQTTAVAENRRNAAALGHSPDRVAAINWALGSALGGVAGILVAPIAGLQPTRLTELVVPGLAAGVIASMSSFPVALASALLIGVAQSYLTRYVSAPGWSTMVPLVVILVVMFLRGTDLPDRSHVRLRFPAVGNGRIAAVPAAVFALIAVLVMFVLPVRWVDALTASLIISVILLSLVVVTGYAGQLSLMQFALAGVGALIAARLVADRGWPFELALLAAAVLAIPIGLIIGVPALRTRGPNLAIVTLAVNVALYSMVFTSSTFANGVDGISVGTQTFFGVNIDPIRYPERYATLCILMFVLLAVGVANIRRGRSGRRLVAVRTNERAAASMGISVTSAKLFAFAVGCVIAAVGGVLIAFRFPVVVFDSFQPTQSQSVVAFAVIGGIGYVLGPVLGGTLWPGSFAARVADNLGDTVVEYIDVIGGVILVINLIKAPDGMVTHLTAKLARGWNRLGRRGRHRQDVASTTASTDTASKVPLKLEMNHAQLPLKVRNLSVRFGGVHAVREVSLDVEPGKVVGLIGPNGAGKTTVIDAVTGFVRAQEGTIHLGDRDLTALPAHKRARAGLSRSFQSLELLEDLTVRENLLVASDRADALAYVTDPFLPGRALLTAPVQIAIQEFGLDRCLDLKAGDLPYAQRRLVAVARAVAQQPSVLMLDEPAAGLNDTETVEFGRLVRRLATEAGIAVLIIEHVVDLVMAICDEVVVLDGGRVIASGPPSEVRANDAVIRAYLGASTPEAEDDMTDNVSPASPDRVVVMAADRDRSAAQPVIECRELSVGYGAGAVVKGVNLLVRPGEVVALLGANGAGKTTTLMALAGVMPPLDGQILVDGTPTVASLDRRARNGTAFVAEERSVFMGMSTMDNLKLGRGELERALELFPDLGNLLKRRAGLLSGGEQQMLTLARALAGQPSVLLADELSLGLAPKIVTRLLDSVRAASDAGVGVLLVEQQTRQALRIADRAYVLRRGEIVLEGTAQELAGRMEEIEGHYLGTSSHDLANA